MPTFVLAFFMFKTSHILSLILTSVLLSACKHAPPPAVQEEGEVNVLVDSLEVPQPKIPVYSIEEGQCDTPLSLFSFNNALAFLKEAESDNEKLKLAKEILDKNCLTAYQVSELMEVIASDKQRLDLAKHAYALIYDPVNWSWMLDALQYQWNKESLEMYVRVRN